MTQVRPRVLEKGGAGGRAGEEEAQARQVSGPRGQHPRGRDRSQARGLSGGRTDGQTDRAGGGAHGGAGVSEPPRAWACGGGRARGGEPDVGLFTPSHPCRRGRALEPVPQQGRPGETCRRNRE